MPGAVHNRSRASSRPIRSSLSMITETLNRIAPLAKDWFERAAARQLQLTKPPGSLGALEEIANRLAAIQQMLKPEVARRRIYVVAADHGVVEEGVSAYPREVTAQMVYNFLRGGAAINALGRHGGIEVRVVDAGVCTDLAEAPALIRKKVVRGTANFTRGRAMTRDEAVRSVEIGIELARESAAEGVVLLGIGEMGIGNTTAASAIAATLTGLSPETVTGYGAGVDDAGLQKKIAAIKRALEINRPDRADPIDVLSKVGGAEIGVMAGVTLGAAAERIPVVADGFISTSAAALACVFCSNVSDYLFIGHRSQERGHDSLIEFIGQRPLLDLRMRLGEGTGAALAMHIIGAAARLLGEMATFAEAGVSDRGE
ncbi:MAG: nicotinate-nucleotide--dimethylbenzimidazole phosphoribosyltransferase [Blastocatellia bacterium]|nr:nicotinate-nucleotide--dimethylbenzimidazole phosphoribosyltransferase [Blastocatellia bacterium]